MLLAKRCMKAHNIRNGSLLRLGTLHEYRSIENAQIIDKEEGMLRFKLSFDGQVELHQKWFNTLFAPIRYGSHEAEKFPGGYSIAIDHLQVTGSSEHTVTVLDTSAVVHRDEPNSFIFCMSKIRKTGDCQQLFTGYDDQWYVPFSKHRLLGNRIGGLLIETIKAEFKKGNYMIPKETDIDKLNFDVRYGEIKYTSRDLHITESSQLEEFMEAMWEMAFTKPSEFSTEKEFRFQYDLHVDDIIISPIVDSIMMDADSLRTMTF